MLNVKTENYSHLKVYDAYKKAIFNVIRKGKNADKIISRYKLLKHKSLSEEIESIVTKAELFIC